jgi:hypothetical protein
MVNIIMEFTDQQKVDIAHQVYISTINIFSKGKIATIM